MEEEIDIKDLMVALWRKKIFIIVATIIFLIIGVILYGRNTKSKKVDINEDEVQVSSVEFEEITLSEMKFSKTKFILERGIAESQEYQTTYKLSIDNSVISNFNEFAKSTSFLKSTLEKIGYTEEFNIDDLKNLISITGGGSDVITLTVGFKDQENAIKISNEILSELTNKTNTLYRIEKITVIDGPTALDEEENDEMINSIALGATVNKKENKEVAPEVDKEESSPKKKIILVTVVGFVLACGFVIVRELFDETIKSEETLEKVTNSKTLVKLPKTEFDLSDRFKLLRVNLNECKTILVTSPENGDGKSFVANSLAKSYAKLGKKVILIDLVKNSSGIVKDYDGNGLTDFLESNDNSVNNYIKQTSVDNLDMILAGQNLVNQAELLESYKMKDTLKLLENTYDVIIIDTGNVLDSASTLTLARIVKISILVVSERKTRIENIIRAKNNIEDVGGIVVGTVYNNTMKK